MLRVQTILSKLDKKFVLLSGLLLILGMFIPLSMNNSALAEVSFSSTRNCDSNAIIYCGAMTTSELIQKYNTSSSVQAIYNCFGITSADVNSMGTTAVAGQVTSANTVLVNSKIVATDAITGGRQSMPGSIVVDCDGVSVYKRPPSVSFLSSPLDAFVVMKNGQFAFAILASCGNAVSATPVIPPPAPKSTPTPTPTPPAAPIQQQQQQQQSVVINQVSQQQAVAPKPAPLPNTGPNDLAISGVFGISSMIAGFGHWLFKKKFIKLF